MDGYYQILLKIQYPKWYLGKKIGFDNVFQRTRR